MNPTLEPIIEPGYARTYTRFKRRLWKLLGVKISIFRLTDAFHRVAL